MCATAIAAGALSFSPTPSQAQTLSGGSEVQEAAARSASSSEQEHERGSYLGVKPGGDEKPAVEATPGHGKCTITWPGFQMRPDGTSRVFVQTTGPVTPHTTTAGDRIVIDLGDLAIAGETNRLPLITKFFNTPVTGVELKRESGRTRLVLTVRAGSQPRVSTEQAASGYYFTYVDFPSGDFIPAEQKRGPAEPPPAPEAKPSSAASSGADVDAAFHASGDASMDSGGAKVKAKAKGKVKAQGSLSF